MSPLLPVPRGCTRLVACLMSALALGTGCGSKAKLLRPVSTIDYPTFRSAPLGVGGMTTIIGPKESRAEGREARSSNLERMMISERGDLVVIPVGRVRSLLGDEEHDALLDRFESHGELDARSIAQADSALGSQIRFLLLGRIENESVSHDESESDPDNDSNTDNSDRKLKTTLSVRAGFHVYDLQTRHMVWSGAVVNSASNEAKRARDSESGGSGFWGFMSTLVNVLDDDDDKYPPPPEVDEVLPGIFDALCEGLPKPPKS